jgi:hypothetical protein
VLLAARARASDSNVQLLGSPIGPSGLAHPSASKQRSESEDNVSLGGPPGRTLMHSALARPSGGGARRPSSGTGSSWDMGLAGPQRTSQRCTGSADAEQGTSAAGRVGPPRSPLLAFGLSRSQSARRGSHGDAEAALEEGPSQVLDEGQVGLDLQISALTFIFLYMYGTLLTCGSVYTPIHSICRYCYRALFLCEN